MKHLHRVHPGPDVLRKYDCKTQTWDDVHHQIKKLFGSNWSKCKEKCVRIVREKLIYIRRVINILSILKEKDHTRG